MDHVAPDQSLLLQPEGGDKSDAPWHQICSVDDILALGHILTGDESRDDGAPPTDNRGRGTSLDGTGAGGRRAAQSPIALVPNQTQDHALLHVSKLFEKHRRIATDSTQSIPHQGARLTEATTHMARARTLLIESARPHIFLANISGAVGNILYDTVLEGCRPTVRAAVTAAEIVSVLPLAAAELAAADALGSSEVALSVSATTQLTIFVLERFSYVHSVSLAMRASDTTATLANAVQAQTLPWADNSDLVHRLQTEVRGSVDGLKSVLAHPGHSGKYIIGEMYNGAMAIIALIMDAERPQIERVRTLVAPPRTPSLHASDAPDIGVDLFGGVPQEGSGHVPDDDAHASTTGPLDDIFADSPTDSEWGHPRFDDDDDGRHHSITDDIFDGETMRDDGVDRLDDIMGLGDPGNVVHDGAIFGFDDDVSMLDSDTHGVRQPVVPTAPPLVGPRRPHELLSQMTEDIIVMNLGEFVRRRSADTGNQNRLLSASVHFVNARTHIIDVMAMTHGRVTRTPSERSLVVSEALHSLRPSVHVAFAAVELVLICDLVEVTIADNSLRRAWDGAYFDSRVANELFALLESCFTAITTVAALLGGPEGVIMNQDDLPGVTFEQRRHILAKVYGVCRNIEPMLESARRAHEQGIPAIFWKIVFSQTDVHAHRPDIFAHMHTVAWLVAHTFALAEERRIGSRETLGIFP